MVSASRRRDVESVLALSTCPFSRLSQEVRTLLAAGMRVREYAAGDVLMEQGAPGDFMVVVIEGAATAQVRQPTGQLKSVGNLEPGSVSGEMSLVTDEPRTADVVCRTPVRAALIPTEDFDALALRYPELRTLLTEVVAQRLGHGTFDGLSGKNIHGYRIERCVGRGGMGIVYEATELENERRVALKMMSHRLLLQPKAIERFQGEAATLKSLSHSAVASLYERFSAYKTEFLVMEFCEGVTLRNLISTRGPLKEPFVRKIVGQLAHVLNYVHGRGLIHRDLKPSNVMISASGLVKLLDFGLASAVRVGGLQPSDADSTVSGALSSSIECVGTPRYMAPEQFGSDPLDRRVDWYGLACITYEALAGNPVNQGSGLFEIIRQQQQFVLPPASEIGPGVSAEMHAFLAGALKGRSRDRVIDLEKLCRWAAPVELTKLMDTSNDGVDSKTETGV